MMVKFNVINFRLLLLPIALVIFQANTSSAQSPKEMKSIFAQAESHYLYEEYELANQLYLLLETPDNMNIKYKIGICYLNIPGEKEKSIPYLEDAIKTASYDSKTESFKETRAPLDAYFSLAKAYMINNDLEKGLLTLQKFSKLAGETTSKGGMKNVDYIDQQIQACNNAIQFKENPVIVSRKSLGSDFNQGSINENATVSYDGNTIVYTERRGIVNVIFFSKKEKGIWQSPVEITTDLKAGEDCSSCSLNGDGTELFLYKTDNYDGALYSSNYIDGIWTPIKKLNKNINTKFYESHASVSYDGKRLYFTSNRDNEDGNLDIYVSEKDGTGDWGTAVKLGKAINTPFNEDTPFITQDDSVLFFSSEGHKSMGGYDIFKSIRSDSVWQTPLNLGYPVNSSDDDKFFHPFNNELNAYYTLTTGYKKRDIFYLGIGYDMNKEFEISGKVTLEDTTILFDKKFAIHLIDKLKGDTLNVGYPDSKTGLYSFYVDNGQYSLVYTGPGYAPKSIDTTLVLNTTSKVLIFDVLLKKDRSSDSAVFDRISLLDIPTVSDVDTSTLIRNLNVNDLGDTNINDSDILYYTVQVIALLKPVDIKYFKHIPDIEVMYNDIDKFYRYTTGRFSNREEAFALRLKLLEKGYPDDIFIKKVSKQ